MYSCKMHIICSYTRDQSPPNSADGSHQSKKFSV